LYQPEIPQNTGNVARTCVAVGAKLWLVRPLGFQLEDRYLRRAGLDYWQHLQWEVVDNWETLGHTLPLQRAWYFSKIARRPYTDARMQEGDVLVFGCETQGLPQRLLAAHENRALVIPTRPEVRSLNLSNAVAVALYEALRQWEERSSTRQDATTGHRSPSERIV
jgi:tRNA (cytidine/uridine-2'-O-)-methyltransferase